MLGLVAVMLLGSVMAATASAEPGPFWHHREIGGKGEGEKIEPKAPENFKGTGGEQTLIGKVGGATVELSSPAIQVKGAIYNEPHQGQIKLAIFYQPITVKVGGVVVNNCNAFVGQQNQFPNAVVVKGHLAWKWDGTKQQLEEQPQKQQKWDIVFTQVEPQEQPGRPLIDMREASFGSFAEINITGSGCGVIAGKRIVGGAEIGLPSLSQLGEWSKKLAVRTLQSGQFPKEVLGTTPPEKEGFLQHIWVGNGYQPLVLGLTFAGLPANLIGQTETEAEQQEISVFEK